MAISVKVIQQPVGEPITLAEAKSACRVDSDITADDSFICDLIRRARTYTESIYGISLVSQTVVFSWDQFPRPSQTAGVQQQSDGLWDQRIPITEFAAKAWPERAVFRFTRNPLQRVLSVQYLDTSNTLQTIDPTLYRVDYDSDPARLSPAYGQIWPIGLLAMQTVKVQAVVGYGPSTKIPLPVNAGQQTVTPASMTGIYPQALTDPIFPGTVLAIDDGVNREFVTATATTGSTFTANFANSHGANCSVQPAIPETLRGEMLMRISDWYMNREGQSSQPPLALEALRWANWNGELI